MKRTSVKLGQQTRCTLAHKMKYNPGLVGASQPQGRALFPRGALGFVPFGCDPPTQPGPRGLRRRSSLQPPGPGSGSGRRWRLRAVPRATTGGRCGTKNTRRAPSWRRGRLLEVMTVTLAHRLFSNSSPGFKRHCYELTRRKDSADEARVSDSLGLFSNYSLTHFPPSGTGSHLHAMRCRLYIW